MLFCLSKLPAPEASMRLRALLLLLVSCSCWTDDVVLFVVPSLSQQCLDSTEDDEAIVARSAIQQHNYYAPIFQRKDRALRTTRKQLSSTRPFRQDGCLVQPSDPYLLMSLQI